MKERMVQKQSRQAGPQIRLKNSRKIGCRAARKLGRSTGSEAMNRNRGSATVSRPTICHRGISCARNISSIGTSGTISAKSQEATRNPIKRQTTSQNKDKDRTGPPVFVFFYLSKEEKQT
ncbi:hypothetical protein [Paenibacillus sp. RC84]|uniref:hypothetical protein n=1 Tax=Paenibacillus sp. RC84 TaxID=3156252 RepID=UPI0035187D2C